MDFHHVLPGVGVGGAHQGEENLVQDVSLGIKEVPQVEAVGLPGGAGAAGAEEPAGDGFGFGAGEAHDADARLSGRRGDGGDGVPRLGPGHSDSELSPWRSFFRMG